MVYKVLIGFSILLSACSGNQNLSNSKLPGASDLLIENGVNRGTRYLDSKGKDRILTHIQATITNQGKDTLNFQMSFLKEYDFPDTETEATFKVVLLSEKWRSASPPTQTMLDELEDPKLDLDKVIKPGEKITFAIGTIRHVPTNCSPIPNVLFLNDQEDAFQSCVNLMDNHKSTTAQNALGLKLIYCNDRCTLIPCGKVSYLENSTEKQ